MTQAVTVEYDMLLAQAYSNGFACHGDLLMDREAFGAHILNVVAKHLGSSPPEAETVSLIARLHTNDLYLAAACSLGRERAWQRFSDKYQQYLNGLAASICNTRDSAQELATSVLADLFLPDRSGRPRIASYEGRSTLASWLRAIISNQSINDHLRKSNGSLDLSSISETASVNSLTSIEATIRANRYQEVLASALKSASATLTERERLLLLLRYDEELRVSRVARLLGVHPSTVTRQLDRIQEKLRDAVVSALLTQHMLKHVELEECVAELLENPSHSILSIMKGRL